MKQGSARWVIFIGMAALAGAATAAAPPIDPALPVPGPAPQLSTVSRTAPPSAPVPWREALSRSPIHFAADVVPILTKAGCNQGACHGAQSGKGGFKQSLRGWDPSFDWEQIVKDSNGKRIDKTHPVKSLVFLKPTAQVSHGGGQRFKPDSPEAQALLRWLKEGAQAPDDKLT